jgi:putative methyltransferase (TIGR04325 family)
MNRRVRDIVLSLMPHALVSERQRRKHTIRYVGEYSNWEEARKFSSGYDDQAIFQKVKDAALKVQRGEASWERDSVLCERVQHSWPVLAALLWVASKNDNRLSILDFGGSLGSSYFQNRKFLVHLRQLRWNVVEQKHFVDCGKELLEDDTLRFHYDLALCAKEENPSVVLLSSVLQYVPDPYGVISRIFNLGVPYVIIDVTPFVEASRDRLTVQRVPPTIYDASYPCWIFGERRFMEEIGRMYQTVEEFAVRVDPPVHFKGADVSFKGFIMKKRS